MIFPEGVLYDSSAFGTTKTADIYTLKQLIDTPNSTMVPPEGIEPPTTGSKPVVISISPRGRYLLSIKSTDKNTELQLFKKIAPATGYAIGADERAVKASN